MMDGRESSFQLLSESPTQRAVSPNSEERQGGSCKHSFLIDFRAMIFMGVVCGAFFVGGIARTNLYLSSPWCRGHCTLKTHRHS